MWNRGYRAEVGLLAQEVSEHVQTHCDRQTAEDLSKDIQNVIHQEFEDPPHRHSNSNSRMKVEPGERRESRRQVHSTTKRARSESSEPGDTLPGSSMPTRSVTKRNKPIRGAEEQVTEMVYNAVEGLAPMTAKQAIAYALKHPEIPVRFYNAHSVCVPPLSDHSPLLVCV